MNGHPNSAGPTPPATAAMAGLVLVFVTLLWGLSFPLVKDWQNASRDCPAGAHGAGATLVAVRMTLALVLLAAAQPGLFLRSTLREHRAGAVVGLAFSAGFILQVIGLAWTTPAVSAFYTGLCSVWVPLIGWLVWRSAVSWLTLLGLGCGLAGAVVLSEIDTGPAPGLGPGEQFTLIASVFFALQILLLDRFGRGLRAANITPSFMAVTAVVAGGTAAASGALAPGLTPWQGVLGWLGWTAAMLARPGILAEVLVLTVFSTVLAFYLMNVYQPRVASPTQAALIYLLEPVFASVLSVATGHDVLTTRLVLGGGLVVAGNLCVDLPAWVLERVRARRRARKTGRSSLAPGSPARDRGRAAGKNDQD